MQGQTEEQFAQELARLFEDVRNYPEDARSVPQWAIADRLLERYSSKPIPQVVADVTGKAMVTLQDYRTTAKKWPASRRNYEMSYGTHRDLNTREDRFTLIYEVETRNDARELVGNAPAPSGQSLDARDQAADSGTARRDPTANEMVDALERQPGLRADMIKRVPTIVEDMTATAEYLKTAGELSDDDIARERERAATRRSHREANADEMLKPLERTIDKFELAFRKAEKELDDTIRIMRNVNEHDVPADDYVSGLVDKVRQVVLELRFYEAKHGRHLTFDAVRQEGEGL